MVAFLSHRHDATHESGTMHPSRRSLEGVLQALIPSESFQPVSPGCDIHSARCPLLPLHPKTLLLKNSWRPTEGRSRPA